MPAKNCIDFEEVCLAYVERCMAGYASLINNNQNSLNIANTLWIKAIISKRTFVWAASSVRNKPGRKLCLGTCDCSCDFFGCSASPWTTINLVRCWLSNLTRVKLKKSDNNTHDVSDASLHHFVFHCSYICRFCTSNMRLQGNKTIPLPVQNYSTTDQTNYRQYRLHSTVHVQRTTTSTSTSNREE